MCFCFLKKTPPPPKKKFSSCFEFDSVVDLAVNKGFFCIFKNTDQNNFCVSIVLKAKTEKKLRTKIGRPPKRAFFSFEIKTVKKPSLTAKNGQNGVFDGQ